MKSKNSFFLQAIISLIVALMLSGCFSFKKDKVEGLPPDGQTLNSLDQQLRSAEELIEKSQFFEAEKQLREYVKDWSYSVYILRAKIDLARSLYGQGQFQSSIDIYLDVIESSADRFHKITGLSLYYMSYSYEMMEQKEKAFAALKDAEKLSEHLPERIRFSELPARLALYYRHAGDNELSNLYFQKAEKDMMRIFRDEKSETETEKAKTYFLMGQLNTHQADENSFERLIGSLSLSQIFLLRSIETRNQYWSDLATDELIKNYSQLWNSILSFSMSNDPDITLAKQKYQQKRIDSVQKILSNIEILKTYHQLQKSNKNTKKIFHFLKGLAENGNKIIVQSTESAIPTEEMIQRQKLKKNIKLKSAPLFENEKSNKENVKDPNL